MSLQECLIACIPKGSKPRVVLKFIYLGFNVAFNSVQVMSQRVVGRGEETST